MSATVALAGSKPYPRYKDTGVRWLGEVPEHWKVRRLRNVVDMRVSNIDKHTKEGEMPVRLCNYVDVYKNDRITARLPFMRATALPDEIERFRLNQNDVLITKDSEAWDDIGVPALVEYTADDLVCGYHLALLRPRRRDLDGAYLLRVLQSPAIACQFYIAANGVTRYGLSHEAIKSVLVPLPPLPDQSAIACFLDHIDRRVRRYIGAKLKLIKFLEEEKQAIIHRAVTCGLDPTVSFKPSRVEWLGDVPRHWEVGKLGHLFRVTSGSTPSRSAANFYGGDIPWVKTAELRDSDIHQADEYVTQQAMQASSLPLLPVDTLLIAMYGQGKTRGRTGLLKIEATINQAALAILPNRSRAIPEYLQLWFISQYRILRYLSESRNATQPNLNAEIIRKLRVVLPPLAEQSEILNAICEETNAVDNTMSNARHGITLLCEYRTRLIADVVTGKLDVREAAAKLPDEAEDLEELPVGEEALEELAADEDLGAEELAGKEVAA